MSLKRAILGVVEGNIINNVTVAMAARPDTAFYHVNDNIEMIDKMTSCLSKTVWSIRRVKKLFDRKTHPPFNRLNVLKINLNPINTN